jgi:hypothetical protein
LICISGSSFYNIARYLGESLLISSNKIKRYLFYLIDYDLVSYNGQKSLFSIEKGGLEILSMIDKEKREERITIGDIVITIE